MGQHLPLPLFYIKVKLLLSIGSLTCSLGALLKQPSELIADLIRCILVLRLQYSCTLLLCIFNEFPHVVGFQIGDCVNNELFVREPLLPRKVWQIAHFSCIVLEFVIDKFDRELHVAWQVQPITSSFLRA